MPCYRENVASLKALLKAPCIGEIPRLAEPTPELMASYLSLDLVIKG